MQLNALGAIVQRGWWDLPDHYPHVQLDAFVVMPNHGHGVIILIDTTSGGSVENVGKVI